MFSAIVIKDVPKHIPSIPPMAAKTSTNDYNILIILYVCLINLKRVIELKSYCDYLCIMITKDWI